MKLLNSKTLRLEEFSGSGIPKYAILSHTWGSDEVSFADLQSGNHVDKAGFWKIQRAAKQAVDQNLGYIWIDTCCIDKSSSAELSEAINSMFQWHRNAEICYAYLHDVDPDDVVDFQALHQSMRSSRWFTRGWTLQELIAPRKLTFFAKLWTGLTSRNYFAATLSEITGIDIEMLLDDRPEDLVRVLQRYSVAQRMSWASKRQTTRIEDQAYSLLGLFQVNMPLIYGEGTSAFIRLQEEILRISADLSILAWSPSETSNNVRIYEWTETNQSILAPAPYNFRNAGSIVSTGAAPQEISMSSVGLRIIAPVLVDGQSRLAVILHCQHQNDFSNVIALKVDSYPLSYEDALKQDPIYRRIGWLEGQQFERLQLIDAVQIFSESNVRNVQLSNRHLLGERSQDARSIGIECDLPVDGNREYTKLWLRFTDPMQREAWKPQCSYPSSRWSSSALTFDLGAAGADREHDRELYLRASQKRGLLVQGGIALSDSRGNKVAIHFKHFSGCRLRYEVEQCDDTFLEKSVQWQVHTNNSAQLQDGTWLKADLYCDEIAREVVARLSITIADSKKGQSRDSESASYSSRIGIARHRRKETP